MRHSAARSAARLRSIQSCSAPIVRAFTSNAGSGRPDDPPLDDDDGAGGTAAMSAAVVPIPAMAALSLSAAAAESDASGDMTPVSDEPAPVFSAGLRGGDNKLARAFADAVAAAEAVVVWRACDWGCPCACAWEGCEYMAVSHARTAANCAGSGWAAESSASITTALVGDGVPATTAVAAAVDGGEMVDVADGMGVTGGGMGPLIKASNGLVPPPLTSKAALAAEDGSDMPGL
jgi:hypothetical protein